MHSKRLLAGAAVGALMLSPFAAFAQTSPSAGAIAVACTMDAKMCPDGTYVGRTGPNCEFVCPGTTTPVPTPTLLSPVSGDIKGILKRGMSSDVVKDYQMILKSDPSIYAGPVTGYYGAMTETAVKRLQAKYGLPQTGQIDEPTRAILFPADTQIDLTIVSPNGGETWKTGVPQKILWKATFGPKPCLPRPACLDSEPRCLPAEPAEGWCPVILPMMDAKGGQATGAGSAAGAASVLGGGVASSGTGVAMPAQTIVARPRIEPFFPRATITLTRDSDPSFARYIGTVNLNESSKIWTPPANVPEGKDYRVRIAIGGETPCLYRAETEAASAGRALDASVTYPCPMADMSGAATGANMMPAYYPIYSTTDSSDNTFAIVGGTSDTTIAELKRKLAEIEAMLVKLQEQVNLLRKAIGQL